MSYLIYIGKNIKANDNNYRTIKFWSFCYCTQGQAIMLDQKGNSYTVSANQMLIIPPKFVHKVSYSEDFGNICFTVDICPLDIDQYVIRDNKYRDLFNICDITLRNINKSQTIDEEFELNMLQSILFVIKKLNQEQYENDYINCISTEIVNNLNDTQFSLDSVFEDYDLSTDYLRRQFIKEMGVSPLQFLNNSRIGFAKRLLFCKDKHNLKIYDIAKYSGFEDQLYFSRVFRKLTGESPKDFSQKNNIINYKK